MLTNVNKWNLFVKLLLTIEIMLFRLLKIMKIVEVMDISIAKI